MSKAILILSDTPEDYDYYRDDYDTDRLEWLSNMFSNFDAESLGMTEEEFEAKYDEQIKEYNELAEALHQTLDF